MKASEYLEELADGTVLDRAAAGSGSEVLSSSQRVGVVIIAAVLVVFAPIADATSPFWLNILTRILIFGLLAVSLDFIFGYAGLLSFGHAAMYGTGGYAAAWLISEVTTNALVVLPLSIVVGCGVAAFIGWFSVRARGIYFAMLTLAFAQVFYVVILTDLPAQVLGVETITGADDGLFGIARYGVFGIELGGGLPYFYLTFGLVLASFAVLVRVANSPFGRVLQAIRENEDRVEFIGYNVQRYKLIAFTISGGFAGLAGGLYVPFQSVASPGLLNWTVSGELIVMLLLGGLGTFWGPILGAGVVIFLEEQLAGFATWEIILGTVFVVVVIFAPRGIAGSLETLASDPRAAVERTKEALSSYRESIKR